MKSVVRFDATYWEITCCKRCNFWESHACFSNYRRASKGTFENWYK